jgi:predicted GH43/DUF377 family glycosyl hydrolase
MIKLILILLLLSIVVYLLVSEICYGYTDLSSTYNKQIDFDLPYPLHSHNSSISKEKENYVVYSRIDTFPFTSPENRGHISLGISILDKNFNIISQKIETPSPGLIIEDLRSFFWKNKKYFIGSYYYNNPLFCPVILDEKYNIYHILDKDLKTYTKNKNFIPIEIQGQLYIIKNHNPLEILKVDKKENFLTDLYFSSEKRDDIPDLRGSTLYEPIGAGRFLGITHTVNLLKKYRHYFTILNTSDPKNMYIEKVSKPLCVLGGCGIEFVMGFTESFDRKSYVITLGKKDLTSHIVVINKEDVNDYFTENTQSRNKIF